MNELIRQITREFKNRISLLYKNKLANVILFGSQARDDAKDGSDVDILIVLKGDVNPVEEIKKISELRYSISTEFDKVISCVFTSEEKFLNENIPLFLNVKREGIVL
jgi:predicted nucleotidyltransferase